MLQRYSRPLGKVTPMKRQKSLRGFAMIAISAFVLAACESSEDRAERHYGQAVELVERGDPARALLELRNVFRYNGTHQEARKLYADLNMEQGNIGEATRHYLLLVEQYPDLVEVRQTLAEVAIDNNNWDEAVRHGEVAQRLAPDDHRSIILNLALAYQQAVIDRDSTERSALYERARAMVEEHPDSIILRRVMIDYLFSGPDSQQALPEVETALSLQEDDLRLHTLKLQLLFRADNAAAVTTQLETMVARFPENTDLASDLLRWHISQGNPDRAEAFLRAQAADAPDEPDRHLTVVDLLLATKGRDAGRAELDRLVAESEATPNQDVFRAALAVLDFQDGAQEQAIETLEALSDEAEPSAQMRELRMRLAAMYLATDQEAAAKEQISTILNEDRTHVAALTQRAEWALREGEITQALSDLRNAQAQAPRDPRIMQLLATAFARDGSMDLAGEQLAMAVQASGNAPAETLRYVSFLRQQGRTSAIENLLNDARRVSPQDVSILSSLAELYLQNARWNEARGVADDLAATSDEDAQITAQRIQAAILLGQNRIDEGLSLLQEQANPSDGNLASVATVLTAQLRAGRADEARVYLESLLAENPDQPEFILLSANLEAVLGNIDAAEANYRTVLQARPDSDNAARLLHGLLLGEGREEEASEVIIAGLQANPDSVPLQWIRAQDLERAGDIDNAIEVYRQLHSADPTNVIASNNLASLLTTYRDDEDSLAEAQQLVRPLRNSTVPAFQDTYGWIAFRTGDLVTARTNLESAAEALPDEPLVQFHLGMLYAELGIEAEAIEQLERAISLSSGQEMPQMDVARARLEELRSGVTASQ